MDVEASAAQTALPYSLALRLRDAGLAAELVCEYVGVEEVGLDGFYRLAEAKFAAAQARNTSRSGKSY